MDARSGGAYDDGGRRIRRGRWPRASQGEVWNGWTGSPKTEHRRWAPGATMPRQRN